MLGLIIAFLVVAGLGYAIWRVVRARPKPGSLAAKVIGVPKGNAKSEIPDAPVRRIAPIGSDVPQVATVPPVPHRPADVFISYKREERSRVEAIAKALRQLHFDVWFDAKLISGNSFDDEINREVRAAKAILVCWSKASVSSEWVRAEASIGRQRGVLAACFLDQCEPYTPFNLVHAEDLSTGTLDSSNPSWVKLVDQLGNLVGRRGLGSYLTLSSDRRESAAWIGDHPRDPLVEIVLQRLRQNG